ncbi:HPr kinase/phosphorylase [Zavarzinia sp.]|uniref:HPr kinase/phosphorylase n=1 Tax=Zavarzinia sp. TaxID=2027920 RepID=UPI003565D02B
MSVESPLLFHATCVALGGRGVLLRGPSGAGKSDLALRLIDRGALLVADDQVSVAVEDGRAVARAPAALRGLLEVRGLGILRFESADSAPLHLVVDLAGPGEVERMPPPATESIGDLRLSRFAVNPFEASAPLKVALALDAAGGLREVMR